MWKTFAFQGLSCSFIYVSFQHSSTQIIIIKSTQIASSNQIKSKFPNNYHLLISQGETFIYLNKQISKRCFLPLFKAPLFATKALASSYPMSSNPKPQPLGSKKKWKKKHTKNHTVDGWNPAPPRMIIIPLLLGFLASQVVQDFFHQQYESFESPYQYFRYYDYIYINV